MKLTDFLYYKTPGTITFRNVLSILTWLILFSTSAFSQEPAPQLSSQKLKDLSIEELMGIEVTSVSKTPEKLTEAASAIQVITQQDIQRSAATNVPEALRLVPNLQVTQLNSRHWIISARGFNSTFSNKLLVMIDGRTVYSPLFAGVFWDAQSVLLEDVDRIEVISGPGAALWGANAVNGVINIITKSAKDTQGLFVSAGGGTFLQRFAEARYGGKIGSEANYRIYAQHNDRDHTFLPNGTDNMDKWRFSQAGFDLDWNLSQADMLNVQGNFYMGKERDSPPASGIDGQNIMGKWTHNLSDSSNIIVQAYADRTWRVELDPENMLSDELTTYDFDFQHNLSPGKYHRFIWGLGYRFMNDKTHNFTQFVGFVPADRKMHLFSSFVQDEISVSQKFKLTLGAKLQHTTFTGFEIQPNARLSYLLTKQQVLWAAASRAVRAPSRIDVDYHIPVYPLPDSVRHVAGGPDFASEKVMAYELGYRIQPFRGLSLSLATFYNQYDDLYSVVPLPDTKVYQIQNGAEGHSYGAELSGNYVLSTNWRLRGGYTYFFKKVKNKPDNVTDPATLAGLGVDANHQAVLQSILDLPANFQLDITARYSDPLPTTIYNLYVPAYFTLDTRIAWKFQKRLEFSVNGQNLLKKRHTEVGPNRQIPRNIYGKIVWRY
ncbi:TonB-dependent receptor (plasmid) [Pedobacter sp. BS3]|uniref:TonB-dependent receptor plug domain-containing protein n=1 Tax=Pedobacter sp. BS3 TaxID=2567937 RepID=UPI0011EE052F|nr:TonB-dependent receptor [Pedobacter sp. BS3]TZF86403.1 TonB-dependent receptor [Pedobacter sp. BS3]